MSSLSFTVALTHSLTRGVQNYAPILISGGLGLGGPDAVGGAGRPAGGLGRLGLSAPGGLGRFGLLAPGILDAVGGVGRFLGGSGSRAGSGSGSGSGAGGGVCTGSGSGSGSGSGGACGLGGSGLARPPPAGGTGNALLIDWRAPRTGTPRARPRAGTGGAPAAPEGVATAAGGPGGRGGRPRPRLAPGVGGRPRPRPSGAPRLDERRLEEAGESLEWLGNAESSAGAAMVGGGARRGTGPVEAREGAAATVRLGLGGIAGLEGMACDGRGGSGSSSSSRGGSGGGGPRLRSARSGTGGA